MRATSSPTPPPTTPRARSSPELFQVRRTHLCVRRTWKTKSFRLHADAAVDADRLAVHVTVGDELDGERREFLGRAEAMREQHVLLELLLEGVGAFALPVDRGVDEPRGDGVDADADG